MPDHVPKTGAGVDGRHVVIVPEKRKGVGMREVRGYGMDASFDGELVVVTARSGAKTARAAGLGCEAWGATRASSVSLSAMKLVVVVLGAGPKAGWLGTQAGGETTGRAPLWLRACAWLCRGAGVLMLRCLCQTA